MPFAIQRSSVKSVEFKWLYEVATKRMSLQSTPQPQRSGEDLGTAAA